MCDFRYQALPLFSCNIEKLGGPGDEASYMYLSFGIVVEDKLLSFHDLLLFVHMQMLSSVSSMEHVCQRLQQTYSVRGSGGMRGPPEKK